MIDNAQPVEYTQLYAQAVAALNNNERYWLTHEEEALQMQANEEFQQRPLFEDLFFQYVKKLEDKGYTEHSEVFVDGTKIESKANRYTLSARSMPYTDRPVPNHSATAMRPFLEQHLYVYEQSAFPVH